MNFYTTMIYVIDTGYSGTHLDVISEPDSVGHGTAMINLIKVYSPKSQITCMRISEEMNKCELLRILLDVKTRIKPQDILLTTWVVERNPEIDFIIEEIAKTNRVVCAAGNMSDDFALYSPAGAHGVTTVACINKSGSLAQMSNYSMTLPFEVMYGTSVVVQGMTARMTIAGTSPAASIYAALLDRSKGRMSFLRRANKMLRAKYRRELGL